MANDRDLFYRHRDRFNHLIGNGGAHTAEAASIFYFLNRTCFNGLCRFNRSGRFNVPFGRYARIRYIRDFSAFAPALAEWTFDSGDFETVDLERGDFVYADPPYDVQFTQYSRGGFSWEDQERTAAWLARHRGPAVLVNQATPRVLELYRSLGYRLATVDAPRRISRTGDRTAAREVIATRNLE
jgi:DNA adenine methylase